MGGRIGDATGILALVLGDPHALTLAFAPGVVVVTRHLQCQLQKHVLNGFEDDFRNPVCLGRQVGQIDDTGHRQASALGADRPE